MLFVRRHEIISNKIFAYVFIDYTYLPFATVVKVITVK